MLPVLKLQIRPGRRWLRSVMGVVVLAVAVAMVLPAGPVAHASPASALMITTQPLLRIGSRDPAVIQLQHRLATLHYDVGSIDGVFGSQTFQAWSPSRRSTGWSVTGSWDRGPGTPWPTP